MVILGTVSSIGNIGYAAYREPYFTPIIRLKTFVPDENIVNTKFLYYVLQNINFIGTNSSLSSINTNDIKKYTICIPSLSEQERIVNILDKFDSLVNDIFIGLPAEIEARRKQYEYYRNKLLTFKQIA